ncbi:MAG: DPP IV N-terminal domain-containing protein [Pseudomonadota bacterium]
MRTILSLLLFVGAAGSGASSAEGAAAPDKITLEWIHKKDKLDIHDPRDDLPQGLRWSPAGHLLAYGRKTDVHGDILVVLDASRPDEPIVLTADQIRAVLEGLDEQTAGADLDAPPTIAEATAPAPEEVAEEETDGEGESEAGDQEASAEGENAGIKSYRWLEDENLLLLTVDDERVRFDPVAYRVFADPDPDLPEGDNENVQRSPNDRFAAYTRDNDLYAFDFENKREIRLTEDGSSTVLNGKFPWVYWEEFMWRRTYRAFWWKPQGDAIAFLQFDEAVVSTYPVTDFSETVPETHDQRYPKVGTTNPTVRLGIVNLSSRETNWVELTEPHEYLIHVGWSEQGDFLSVQALDRRQDRLVLYRVDPSTTRGEIVLTESRDTWVDSDEPPRFLEESNDFIWLSERSGYRHLYRVGDDPDDPKALTRGDWVVDRAGWDGRSLFVHEDAGRVYFRGTRETPLERHVYWVPSNGGRIRQITAEPGWHSMYFSDDGTYWIDQWSSADVPSRIDLRDSDGDLVKTLGEVTPADYAPIRFPDTEYVTIKDGDGTVFHASVVRPHGFDPAKRYPVVAYVYGEPAGQVVRNSWISSFHALLAERGFVVFSFDGRGTPGRGRPFLDPIHKDQMTVPMADWRVAAAWLREQPFVDGDRMGVWGWSGGGTMTLNLMLRTPGLFAAGAAVAAVSDKRLYDTIYTERYLGVLGENEDGYEASSPLFAAADLEGELLIAHGIGDDNVHVQNAYNLVEALHVAEKPYELYLYPEKGHGLGGTDDHAQYHVFARILDFFESHLLSGSAPRD